MKILMPYHLGGGNRGCEGIARGLVNILDVSRNDLVLFNYSTDEYVGDKNLGLGEIGELRYPKQHLSFEIKRKIGRLFQKIGIDCIYNNIMSNYYLKNAKVGDVVYITGGDIYCYVGGATIPNLIAKKAKQKGIKSILFGVSIGEEYLTQSVVEGIKEFDLVVSRESLTKSSLDKNGIKNYMFPDPAFSLTSEEVILPDYFQRETVGINISPFTNKNELFTKNMNNLIDYLITKGYEVCFVPHVIWNDQDDRKAMRVFIEKYGDSVHLLETENMSYLQIRYAISRCKFYVGGRTHSIISAYCTEVPCIALGYSVKSIGIAKDIGMPEYTVINSKKFENEEQLLLTFKQLENDYYQIKDIYKKLKDYINYEGLKEVIDTATNIKEQH